MRRTVTWTALAIAVATLVLASWIVIPAPTYFLLAFDVGAPEVSAWLIVAAGVAIALALPDIRTRLTSRVAFACGAAALLLAGSVWVRVPTTISQFDAATKFVSSEPAVPLRAHPIVFADLFRGIPTGAAQVHTDIPYAAPEGQQLTLDVYQPAEHGRYPIVVQIYGGAWQRGSPHDYANFARWLASGGYVVVSIDYRRAPRYQWPKQIEDVDSSLAWIRDNAAKFDGDPSRVVLIGRSAGAHLAMLAAYAPAPLAVRGVISFYGPTDLADAYRNPPHPDPLHIRSVEDAFLGGPPESMPQRYVDASPIAYTTRQLPPTLLIYASRDHIVEPRYGQRMALALAASSTPSAYLEIPWADHAFDAVFNGPSSQLALYYTERFIRWAVSR